MAKSMPASTERPIFRFKVKEKGSGDGLLEVDPNESVPMLYIYRPNKDKQKVACTDVVAEKPVLHPRQLELRIKSRNKSITMQFASRREREQLAGALAYLSQRVKTSPSVVPLKVWMGTWNMGDAPPPDPSLGSLTDWCKIHEDYDIICFTVQECSYKPRHGYKSCEEDWFKTVEALVGKRYFRVDKQSLQSIRVIVFAKVEHRDYVTAVMNKTEATGIAGVYGNKGGVCVSFSIRETRLCFVGCHLAAHQENIEDRNANYAEIVAGLTKMGWKDFWFTNEYHHIFWAGDLNYRIDYDRQKVVQLCYQGLEGWRELYKYDQLQKELAKETVFIDFNESQPLFQPTYKYDRQKDVYPDDSKKRIPSWCDRILWKSMAEEQIVQEDYFATQSVHGSDHRPVYSVFKLDCRNPYIPRSIIDNLNAPPAEHAADVLDSAARSCLVIRHLAGHDLEASDPNGYSDPYVVFMSNVLQNDYRTSVQSRTLNPSWEGGGFGKEGVPVLYVNFEEKEYLESEFLWFSVYDYDISTADDPLGQGHMRLKGITDGLEHHFCVRLQGAGKTTGMLSGTIQLSLYGKS
eukprot:TRINITY_DN9164_c0_g4_i1.p1 TRINITY_DN9164_c0_g4~~TRINITY_DN9164_c0_g4_i1.p1  ORF type:complete len:673 (+),score=118.71 TRINITY_DN9164_c0_g4_i1:295-2019(+)